MAWRERAVRVWCAKLTARMTHADEALLVELRLLLLELRLELALLAPARDRLECLLELLHLVLERLVVGDPLVACAREARRGEA